LLADEGAEFTVRDYFKDRFTVEELRDLLASLGLRPADVISRRARAYKELVGGREADLTDDELLALMVREPTLLRRPLTVRGDRAVVGFDRAALAALTNDAGA
jgi:arsenate reductase (glutaredoxin)